MQAPGRARSIGESHAPKFPRPLGRNKNLAINYYLVEHSISKSIVILEVIEDSFSEASVIAGGDNMGGGLLCGGCGVGDGAAEAAASQHGGIVVTIADGEHVVEGAADNMR